MKLSAILEPLIAAGVPGDELLATVRAFEDHGGDPLSQRRSAERARSRRYRERRSLSGSEWETLCGQVYHRDGYQCAYCGDTAGPFGIDHIRPLSQGGDNSLGNLAVACGACNGGKSGRTVEQWKAKA